MRLIYVTGPTFGIDEIIPKYGYAVATDVDAADGFYGETPACVFFMGGVDINPKLYGEEKIPETEHSNNLRDTKEIAVYHKYKHLPKVGICRGAQLLNVLAGGALYQHVDGHAGGRHYITDIWGDRVLASTVHHQMIIPAKDFEIIGWSSGISKIRKRYGVVENWKLETEPEILWSKQRRELLVQGHPEFGPEAFEKYFFNLLNKTIWS